MTDRLIEKLESMDKQREMRARRLSLTEALQILADGAETGDATEHQRWREFVAVAHARGDFRYLHELDRQEWAAVKFGRQRETWSQPEMSRASARLGMADWQNYGPNATPNPAIEAVRKDWDLAGREGRIFSGPDGAAIMFRSKADPKREETREEMERELNSKLERFAFVAEINKAIDETLERAGAKMSDGNPVVPTSSMVEILERSINAIAKLPSGQFGPHRLSDATTFPRWPELLRAYADAWSLLGGRGVNRAEQLEQRLAIAYRNYDQAARAIAERIVGSPDPLPVELVQVSRGILP